MKLALGLSVHTGWAAAVIVGRKPTIELRDELTILGDDLRFVYHAASLGRPEDAARSVAKARKLAEKAAVKELARICDGRDVAAVAIVASDKPMPASLDQILAAHPLLHTAEGCLYRDVLEAAAAARKLPVIVIPPKAIDLADAPDVAEVGRPWAKDQRLAAVAAWTALSSRR